MKKQHSLASGLLLATILAAGGATAQTKPGSESTQKPAASSSSSSGSNLEIGSAAPQGALRDLRLAVRELRETAVLLLNQKEAGPKRDEVVDSALDAIVEAQRAMASLPSLYRMKSADAREATDWPVAAGRLDKASLALERSIDALEKGDAKNRDQAIDAVQKAMDEVQQAVLALPDWSPGDSEGGSEMTGSTKPAHSSSPSSKDKAR